LTDRSHPVRLQPAATVSGAELWSALGFRNARAFQRAVKAGQVGVKLYPMPAQSRGWFARADELAAYLATSGRQIPSVDESSAK